MSEKFYDEFYRQRRNLILISVVLFFVISSELTWNKYSVWGNEITLKNPDGVLTFLWVIWAYWIWRFWVYALEYKDGFIKSFENSLITSLRNIHDEEMYDMGFTFERGWCSVNRCMITYTFEGDNGEQHENDINYKGRRFYMFSIPTFIRIIISHKSFTDQILPFLIAIVPIIFLIFTKGIF